MLAPSLDALDALDALVAEFNSGDVKQQEAAALQICALSIDPSNHEKIISRSEMFGALLVELGVSSGRAEIREIAVRLILNLLPDVALSVRVPAEERKSQPVPVLPAES